MFQVVWTDQWSTLLTLDDRRIIDDPRISIERPYTKDWNLHIRKASYNDRGQYTCQINTNPVKTKTVMLIVLGNNIFFLHSEDFRLIAVNSFYMPCVVFHQKYLFSLMLPTSIYIDTKEGLN